MSDDVWVLSDKPNQTIQRIINTGEAAGLSVGLYFPRKFVFLVQKDGNNHCFYKGRPIALPKAVINRGMSGRNYFSSQLLYFLETSGVECINSRSSIKLAHDKWKTLQTLNKHRIPHPKSMLLNFPVNQKLIKQNLHRPVVVKRTSGKGGKGLMLIRSRTDLEDLCHVLEQSVDMHSRFLVQEFIKESVGQDIRVIVMDGVGVAAVKRVGKRNKFQSNVSLGGKSEFIPMDSRMKIVAEQAADALGLKFAGIDLLMRNGEYLVCEVNACPGGFAEFREQVGVDLAKMLIDWVSKRVMRI